MLLERCSRDTSFKRSLDFSFIFIYFLYILGLFVFFVFVFRVATSSFARTSSGISKSARAVLASYGSQWRASHRRNRDCTVTLPCGWEEFLSRRAPPSADMVAAVLRPWRSCWGVTKLLGACVSDHLFTRSKPDQVSTGIHQELQETHTAYELASLYNNRLRVHITLLSKAGRDLKRK